MLAGCLGTCLWMWRANMEHLERCEMENERLEGARWEDSLSAEQH